MYSGLGKALFSCIFAANHKLMERFFLLIQMPLLQVLFIQTGIPVVDKNLYWLLPVLAVLGVFASISLFNNLKSRAWFTNQKIKVEIGKSRLYYPEYVKLTITNTGKVDVDLDRPLLVFDNFWIKRKFRISGVEGRDIYPIFLEKGKSHSLNIDLSSFYDYDRKLKRYPKASIVVFNMQGKRLAGHAVYLRKTLIKF